MPTPTNFEHITVFSVGLPLSTSARPQIKDSSWSLPYLYLANLYSFKAQESEEEKSKKLLKEARSLYKQALDHTKKTNVNTRPRIIIAKALAELASGIKTIDEELINRTIKEIEGLITLIDPADFKPDRADCAAYLYNLATWYEIAYDNYVYIPNVKPKEEARRYLAYSLVRSRNFWDAVENDVNFKSLREEGDLEKLKQELAKKLDEEPELVRMTGVNFKTKIGEILEKVDQLLGRPISKQRA